MKRVTYTATALKDLRRMGAVEQKRVVAKIKQYASDPGSLAANVKKLQGSDYLRLRVADWRVIFNEDMQVILIMRVRHRKDAYR